MKCSFSSQQAPAVFQTLATPSWRPSSLSRRPISRSWRSLRASCDAPWPAIRLPAWSRVKKAYTYDPGIPDVWCAQWTDQEWRVCDGLAVKGDVERAGWWIEGLRDGARKTKRVIRREIGESLGCGGEMSFKWGVMIGSFFFYLCNSWNFFRESAFLTI